MTRRKQSEAVPSPTDPRKRRCAAYTRVSGEEGLQQAFSSLDAQREACEAYVASQRAEGWVLLADRYDDGGYSGGTLERPALGRLLADIEAERIDVVVVYKIDRLSRSLMDFAKLVEIFDRHDVTFVSVTQVVHDDDQHGSADAEHPAQLRAVRTRGDRRADPRQVRSLPRPRDVDGWQRAARLRRARSQARGERGRGRDRPADLHGFRGDRLGRRSLRRCCDPRA